MGFSTYSFITLKSNHANVTVARKSSGFIQESDSDMPTSAAGGNAQEHLKLGIEEYQKREYAKALDEFLTSLKLEPENTLALIFSGDALAALGRHQDAIENYKKAIGKGQDAGAHNGWGNALLNLKRYEDAIEQYRQAAAIDPKLAHPHNGWGVALASQGKYEDAIKQYRQATELDSTFVYPHNNWGLALVNLKRYAEAIEQYRIATELDPTRADLSRNWGDALVNLGKNDEAIEKYKQAIGKSDQDANAHNGCGNALTNLGRYDEAIEQYHKAAEVDPKLPYSYYGWGNALLRLNRFQEAIEKFETAIRKDDVLPWGYHSRAFVLSRQGRYRLAREAWEDAGKAYRRCRNEKRHESLTDHFYYYYGSVVQEALGELDDAEALYQEGLKFNPSHQGILRRLAFLHWERSAKLRLGDPVGGKWMEEHWKGNQYFTQAKRCFKEKIGSSPDAAASMVEFAEMLLNAGESGDPLKERFAEAEKNLIEAVDALKGATEQAAAKNDLGVLYTRREEFQKAIRCFEEALRLDPGEFSAWSNLAEAYFKAGYRGKAHSEYLRILRMAPEHLDSVIGLGDIYLAAADEGDKDLYLEAVEQFTKALVFAEGGCPSKRLKSRDRAAIYYSRGYAKVKSFESAGLLRDAKMLEGASKDFQQCKDLDEYHVKARQALRKLDKDEREKSKTIDRLEKLGGPIIFGVAVIVFLLVQVYFYLAPLVAKGAFFFRYPDAAQLSPADYMVITFGALLFGIAGLSLPKLLKLKVGSFELERTQTEQITTSSQLGITAQGTSTLSSSDSLASFR